MIRNDQDLISNWAEEIQKANIIDNELYDRYHVKRGLRDADGRGVLAGLTRIGEIHSYVISDGEIVPEEGRLTYRGLDVGQLTKGIMSEGRYGFEEVIYLLLFGQLPTRSELDSLKEMIVENQKLPYEFIKDMIMGLPCKDIMNVMARSVLGLYSYDDHPDDNQIENVLRQAIKLISVFPLLAVYAYQSLQYHKGLQSLVIHTPIEGLSIAENFLMMLRHDKVYSEIEAKILDLSLMLHAEHGGGNNSSFSVHVITSSGTDTYSAISAAIGSLKGNRHGGANIKVIKMFDEMKANISDWNDDDQIKEYLEQILDKNAFDNTGLIYGMGHAVYTVSDPRATIFKALVGQLAIEKGQEKEFQLLKKIESLAPELMYKRRGNKKKICANIDFYSGFVYQMLNIPEELFTPLFAVSRIVGWSAHRLEEIVNNGKIIRPAYRSVAKKGHYSLLEER
jgi:citrate synthase